MFWVYRVVFAVILSSGNRLVDQHDNTTQYIDRGQGRVENEANRALIYYRMTSFWEHPLDTVSAKNAAGDQI